MTTLKDLKDTKGIAVHVINQEQVKQITKQYYPKWNDYTFPAILYITKVYSYADIFEIFYLCEGKTFSTMVPLDFKITIASDEIQAEYKEQHIQEQIKDFSNTLYDTICVGSDPEVFVQDANKNVIPAFNFLGPKSKPDKTSMGAFTGSNMPRYWDGFQAEFETFPNSCLSYLVDSIYYGLKGVYLKAKAHDKNATLSIKTVMDISPELLETSLPEHVDFGCMPSLNAYSIQTEKRPGREVNFRPAGGHIHFGLGKHTEEKAIPIIKALDAIIGVACVSMFASLDDPRRRMLYGLPGEYRLPAHGIEYRTLSNAWLCHPLITNLVFDISRKVVLLSQRDLFTRVWNATEEETVNCITNSDVASARIILQRNKDIFLKLCTAAYKGNTPEKINKIYELFLNGVETGVDNPSDIIGNWLLDNDTWKSHNESIGKNFKSTWVPVEVKKAA